MLAVPVTRLYDRGSTVTSALLLKNRIGETSISLHPAAAEKLGVQAGGHVKISFNGVSAEVRVEMDDSLSTGVVAVPRSMGLAIHEPVPAKVK